MKTLVCVTVLILTFLSGFTVNIDDETEALLKEIAELRARQKAMQDDFDARIKALENKIASKEHVEVTSGFGKLKLTGLQQVHFDIDDNADDTFHLRRLELKFSGAINPQFDWVVMIDPAKLLKLNVSKNGGNVVDVDQSSRILQDAFVTWKINQNTRVEIGQQKVPISLEGLQSSSALDTIERALFMSQGKLADTRDTGVQLKARCGDFELTGALLNGLGENMNTNDNNQTKAFGSRIVYKPKSLSGLHVGVSAIGGSSINGAKRERFGAELAYISSPLTLKMEAITGVNGSVRSYGWYAHAGFRFSENWEGVFRVDAYEPNSAAWNDHEVDYIFGINHYVLSHRAKLQFNFVHKQFFGGKSSRNQILFSIQSSW